MQIKALFAPDRSPTRPLNEVVNAEDAIDVRSEIDEYVFTEHTLSYLRELMDGLLDTAQGNLPDCLRAWVSGFFGSGKSHFLKLAATVLSNPTLKLPDGSEARALPYLVEKHGLTLPTERLAREFQIRSVIVNLATAVGGGRAAREQPLLYRLESELHRIAGESTLPHIAELEREIRRARKWDAFLAEVREHNERSGDVGTNGHGLEWTASEIRDRASDAHLVLEHVLPSILPKFSDKNAVRAYLLAAEGQAPSAESVVKLALRVAEDLHQSLGRVLLCVDEVALYLAGHPDRVREVQGLAETIKSKGKGKLLLWVTAQQRVDTIDQQFAILAPKVGFLRDRFPARFPIEERDIDTVVRERWLKKSVGGPERAHLEKKLHEHAGLLARAARLHDEIVVRDTAPLTDEQAVLAYYPCLPYHIRLLQEILTSLRGGGEKQVDQTAAQSRALLTAIRALFINQNGANLAEDEVGTLVTFDRVYDVIRDVVRKTDSSTDQWITQNIECEGSAGPIKVSSVAKAIFLLQKLNLPAHRRVKVDAENVAAVLYPRLGAAWEPHLADVREACALLLSKHYIGEEPERGYRFYKQEEMTFQGEVDGQAVDDARLYALLRDTALAQTKALGMDTVPVTAWHKLRVDITVHAGAIALPDPNADPTGLELHLIWPRPNQQTRQTKLWAAQYQGAAHVVLWVLGDTAEAVDHARRALKLEAAIRAYSQRYGQQAVDFLAAEQHKLDVLRDETLHERVAAAIAAGVVIHGGVDTPLVGQSKKPNDVFRETMRGVLDQVFPQIEFGSALLDDAGLRKVFTWKPPQPTPDFFGTLKLFDAGARALTDRPFLKEILLVLRGRPEKDRTGSAILDHFQAPPFGWPEKAVKAGLGVLLRARLVTAKLSDGTVLRKPDDAKAESWLTGTQLFNKSVLESSSLTLTPPERETLTALFADVFEHPGADTVEKLERSAQDDLPKWLARAQAAHAELAGRQLPGAERVKKLVELMERSVAPELPLGRLRQLLDGAGGIAGARANVGPLVEIVRTIERLRAQGRLDALAVAQRAASGVFAAWETASAPEPLPAAARVDLDRLRAATSSERLLHDADVALTTTERLFASYGAAYVQRHAARYAKATEALGSLGAHLAADASTDSTLRASIENLSCDEAVDAAKLAFSDGRCPTCRAPIDRLRTDIELIEHRLDVALRRLDGARSDGNDGRKHASGSPDAKANAPGVEMVLASRAELPRLFEAIATEAERVLCSPRRVRVTFEDPA